MDADADGGCDMRNKNNTRAGDRTEGELAAIGHQRLRSWGCPIRSLDEHLERAPIVDDVVVVPDEIPQLLASIRQRHEDRQLLGHGLAERMIRGDGPAHGLAAFEEQVVHLADCCVDDFHRGQVVLAVDLLFELGPGPGREKIENLRLKLDNCLIERLYVISHDYSFRSVIRRVKHILLNNKKRRNAI